MRECTLLPPRTRHADARLRTFAFALQFPSVEKGRLLVLLLVDGPHRVCQLLARLCTLLFAL